MRFIRIVVVIVVAVGCVWALPVEAAPKYKVKVATIAPADTPWHDGFLETKRNIEQRTNGDVQILLFMGGQLGGEIQTLEQTQLGVIQMWAGSTGSLESLIPDFGVFDLPFLWESTDELYYVLDNVVQDAFFKKIATIGLTPVAWSENGWRHYANKKNPIHTPEDVQKIKWRSQESEVHLATWKAMKAAAIPINMTEVFSALQTSMVDGVDNSLLILSATGWWEAMKYLTLSNHIYQPGILAFNAAFWNKLPAEYQQVMLEEYTRTAIDARQILADFEPEMIEVFKAMGYEVHTLTAEERKLFADQTKVVHDQFADKFSDILPLIIQGKAEFKAKHQ